MTTPFVANTVSACQKGDRDAQRVLYEEFNRRVYRLAVRIVGQDDADDVTQNIFLLVFRKIQSFGGESQFATWLFRLATNECLQHLRSRARRTVAPLTVEPPDVAGRNTNELDHTELLETALKRLDPDLRSIFVLREVEALNYAELAETLQISEGTVASRLNRARKQLKHHLVELGWEP